MPADLEQLERLRLETLRGIDQHHGRVDGGEYAIRVLGKVGVPRCIDKVDDVVAIVELQCGGADGNASGLLHLHPVRDGRAAARLAMDRTGFRNHLRVQRERFGERGFTGVGMGDHRKGSAARYLGRKALRLSAGCTDLAYDVFPVALEGCIWRGSHG